MWKRLQGYGREKERNAQIGNPVLLETTYDEEQLRRNPNVTEAQHANYRYNAPDPQSSSRSPLDPPNYRASEAFTESSVYSRPSNDLAYYDNPTSNPSYANDEISPPSSPEPEQQYSTSNQPRRFRSMRDVSPMDDHRGKPVLPPHGSNIPVLRKAPPVLQTGQTQPAQKFWGGKVAPEGKVKWDEYSGEPTASGAGKTGSVSPNSYAKGVASSGDQLSGMGYHVSVSGPKRKASIKDRMGRFGGRPSPPSVETATHEPWSRATGRSQIAPPLKDQAAKAPLQLPRKTLSPTAERSNTNAPSDNGNRGVRWADTGSVADRPQALESHEDLIKPTVPLKVGRNTPLTSPISPNYPKGLGIQALSNPITPAQRQRNDSPDTVIHEQGLARNLPAQQRVPTPPLEPVAKKSSGRTPDQKEVSNSRFSWTTYNSATTYQHSPPPSPPNLPTTTPPRQRTVTEPISSTSAANSILSRRRPIPQANRPSSPIPSPKSTTMDSPGTATLSSPISRPISPSSTYSTNTTKALPLPPTSLSAADHIAVLESAMEDLRIRRSNVYRLLNDLNNAAPPNPLITDFKRARLVEQRKRSFEDELCEIKREEYEVGMKLHRAWKKREREDPNVGSAIWVRRVTS
ncbi:hypothetical protein HBH70_066040 [Parastagonospora nodorum]|nr:hypothetical protein HBH53_173520 [Parastagonospora nodorum]KAH3961847.1 hypothetical protein HBH52_228700 [Parastagonospora nodorum]KAH3980931.1 hypothetical protein HBH51_047360 [Parastagonospora nodorum]KAH4038715.1 hypothetical protein HBI09_054710 [Parastagonospora nodorum]KAH4072177.1 hypothetical protein HBH50_073520 [Parastagonospora nodorum]